ncbi:MAG: hypothetical protein IJY22_03705 [Clostridia bacterium]|nr:hypothetical protein [Clostridia bacterium]
MTEETKIPIATKKRRTTLQRQRLAVIIVAAVVAVLAVTFGIVYYFTSRIIYTDDDGLRYFVRQRDIPQVLYTGEEVILEDQYVLEDEDGNMMAKDGTNNNYFTKLGTIIHVDANTGEYDVVAKVLTEGGETTEFDVTTMQYDVLLYPYMGNQQISSIVVSNEKGTFTLLKDEEGNFYIDGHKGLNTLNGLMLNTLLNLTGYSTTMTRISFKTAFDPSASDYAAYEGFRQNGYAEYGLPDNPDDATTYFIVKGKDTNGQAVEHKVIIGDKLLSGAGYYVRYVGRDEVYVLREMEQTESYTTLTASLLCPVEDYVTPMVTVPMSTNNYFDVENFSISKFDKTENKYLEVIGFSYSPIQLREGKFAANYPYQLVMKNDALKGFMVNSYRVDDCLQHIQSIVPLRTVKLYSEYPTEEDPDVSLRKFLKEYCHDAGCKKDESCACDLVAAYTIGFDFVSDRDDTTQEHVEGAVYPQQIWISPKTESNTFYLFNAEFNMVVECSLEYLEFVEWDQFEWIEPEIFSGNIAYIEQVEIQVSGGIGTIGGANKVIFDFDNSASEKPSEENNFQITSDNLVITASYGSVLNAKINVYQFRLFYQTLLASSLEGMMPEGTEDAQEDMLASGDEGASLVIKMIYNADGETLVRTYRFYSRTNGNLGAFASLNGTGSFYMIQRRVDKIISDVNKIFTPEDVIKPESKF